MEWFRTWLLGVMSAALLLALVYTLIPKGAIRTIAQFTGGLILILAVLQPLLQLDPSSWKLEYQEYEAQIDEQIANYQKDHREELRTIIENETAAYISDKGSALGITCHPVVMAQVRNDVPYPYEVTLDTPWNDALSRYISQDLDIPVARQHWQGSSRGDT